MPECQHCVLPDGEKTFERQVPIPIEGKVQRIDSCVQEIVATPKCSRRPNCD